MKSRSVVSALTAFLLLASLFSPVKAYSTAWCEVCHQLLVENNGVFAFNGSKFVDLTRQIEPPPLPDLYFPEFVWNLGVATAGNVTVIYSLYHDSLDMGVYNGTFPVFLIPTISWYTGGAGDFLFYNGSIFFVASTSCCGPHYASDDVYRVGPRTMESWDLIRYARKIVPQEKESLTPMAGIKLGLDENGRLWAGVYLWDSNVTLYYLYNGTNFTLVNASPRLHIPKPEPPFRIEVRRGITYYLHYPLRPYTPTRYILIRNGTSRDVTDEVRRLAYSVRPVEVFHGFWDGGRREWVVSFSMYDLPVTYAANGSCRRPINVEGLPLGVYNGSYVLLGNGTLGWRNQTVRTPQQSYPWSKSIVDVEVYVRDGRPVVAFPWETEVNGTARKGFVLYEATENGFEVRNVTGTEEPGRELLVYPISGGEESCRANATGTLCVDTETGTAFIRTENGTVPVNYSVASRTEVVIVGNGTFLLLGEGSTYIVPPYDSPIDVLSLPVCVEKNTTENQGETTGSPKTGQNAVLYGIAALGAVVLIILLKRR
ncbi:hypothetical protein [Thermococcus sp. 21S7]|uniref:hypothetical protein n=1 Tax=Thermococcus sp. 21S7 TaxID=1638221 RepID=UPI00143AA266|nr:hypothetical protein [Thermococcus sp. 21S7]NJE60238.1 hypothetical protein [Thermococcus sp. 21S7]